MARYWLPAGFEPYRAQVHFTGWLAPDQLAQWYRHADVLVVPSWYEPFGMVVLEGMLYGVRPLDPMSFVGGATVLGALALIASLVPAIRAASINPVDALKI